MCEKRVPRIFFASLQPMPKTVIMSKKEKIFATKRHFMITRLQQKQKKSFKKIFLEKFRKYFNSSKSYFSSFCMQTFYATVIKFAIKHIH